MKYQYVDKNNKCPTHEEENPGSFLQSIEPVEFLDREFTRYFREVTTETGYTLGRAERVNGFSSEKWEVYCTFAGACREYNRLYTESGQPFFDSWEDARSAILAECDRREREARGEFEVSA